jgi:leucyl aminopeptidase
MKLQIVDQLPADAEVLVVLLDSRAVDPAAPPLPHLPEAAASLLRELAGKAAYQAKPGELLPVYTGVEGLASQLLGVGLGKPEELKAGQAQTVAAALYKALSSRVTQATVLLEGLEDSLLDAFLLALANASYAFETYKEKPTPRRLASLTLVHPQAADLQARLAFIQAVHQGQNLARDLANQPANVCHPSYMAEQALALAAEFPELLRVTVLDEQQMAELGMNVFLSVGRGSEQPPRLITLEYQGRPDQQPVVLVGKGITFDTGGISIKPAAGMDEMKFDMAGAASVLGVMRALCESRLPIAVVGALACAENMPSGRASRPGDIVKSMSGQTVEILNTDAEGRLVLCDTLTYVKRFNPALVVDIATLTGACIVALGKVVAGLFSPDDALAAELSAAGSVLHDRVWRMPVWEDYQELLDSPVADIANIGGPTAGSVTAACFLARFTRDYRWAHLDIAGVSHLSGPNKGATGRPVPLLMQFLRQRAQSAD